MEEKLEARIEATRIEPSVKEKIVTTAIKDNRKIEEMVRIIFREFNAEEYLRKRGLN
ncbi:MAG TPA: hypothetical protein VN922_19350 [Bacteroidia bacterium]|nr:hypothetical protein [Bacteroidia bacterium]